MPNRFRWKETETQQSVLFWIAVILLVYWGVRRDFNANALVIGLVSSILIGQKFFGSRRTESDPKVQEMGESSEQHTERLGSVSDDDTDSSVLRHRLWPQSLRSRIKQSRLRKQSGKPGSKPSQFPRLVCNSTGGHWGGYSPFSCWVGRSDE